MAAANEIGWRPASIALIDLSYIWKKTWHAQPRDAQPGHAANSVLEQLAGIRESVEHVIICRDWPPYRRRELSPEYKAQRPDPESEEVAQKKWLFERIEKDGYVVAGAKGYEADDIIYTLALTYISTFNCEDVRIVASDKDLAVCVCARARMFVPAVGDRPAEIRGPDEIRAKYGVGPMEMPLWLALVGDTSDNIPGVPGIGPKKAADLINEHRTLNGIAEALATKAAEPKVSAMWKSLADNWEQLRLSLKLATLEAVPLDAHALLVRREPKSIVKEDAMGSGDDGPAYDGELEDELPPVEDLISKAPPGYVAPELRAPKSEPPPKPEEPKTSAIAKTSAYGEVTGDLQPCDLTAARAISKWIHDGRLFSKFGTPEAIFTIIMRGKELGLGVTTSLAGFHLIEGKPSASADMIRSLAERSPDCEYFMLIESSATSATWETKRRGHPKEVRYTYTIEEATKAGLRGGNWEKRPRDMLTKTAGSKLARLVYPGAVLGLYCPEEMGDQ